MRAKSAYIGLFIITASVLGYVGYVGHSHFAAHPTENYGVRRAQIALQEYRKGVAEQTPGCNCGPRIDEYTQGHHAQWCSMFASWVANQAGSPVHSDKTDSWRIPKSRDFAAYLQKHGTWHSRDEILRTGVKPLVGDLLVYWRTDDYDADLGHIEIVTDPDKGPGTAGVVGGNIGHKVYARDVAYASNSKLLGFGRPEK